MYFYCYNFYLSFQGITYNVVEFGNSGRRKGMHGASEAIVIFQYRRVSQPCPPWQRAYAENNEGNLKEEEEEAVMTAESYG